VSPAIIDNQSEFVKNKMKIPLMQLLNNTIGVKIREQLEILHTNKSPQRVDLSTLNNWKQKEKNLTVNLAMVSVPLPLLQQWW
jgi:hypothetical protein